MYILMINIHGLFRSDDVEFGRDADTGGQTRYVLELSRALGSAEGVDRVDVATRMIRDKRVSEGYSVPEESLGGVARIVRLPCGGYKYIRKEKLWPLLDEFTDRLIGYLREQERLPDVVHGHYADAGYVAEQIATTFGIPLVYSAHSLGRNKLAFLESQGWSEEKADEIYSIRTRIRAEEAALSRADLVIASTKYEQEELYGLYENRRRPRYAVIPPGLDLDSFFPYYDYELPGDRISDAQKQAHVRMTQELRRFHFEPDKPVILSLCRPDARKNIDRLIEVYGRDKELQALANLAIFAGLREDISFMEEGERQVLTDILLLMDKYDLYGKMAIPKNHDPARDVPEMYRIAALRHGVFASASYLETFGLTFVEASAAGLPFVASDAGGPVDIAENCGSGLLVDTTDDEAVSSALKKILTDPAVWSELSENGVNRTREVYSWDRHVKSYLKELAGLSSKIPVTFSQSESDKPFGRRLKSLHVLLVADIDGTLLGDAEAASRLGRWLTERRDEVGFGVATGRSLESALAALKGSGLPSPDILTASVGSEIYYGAGNEPDRGWRSHIQRGWKPQAVRHALDALSFLTVQEDTGSQRDFKISYLLETGIPDSEMLPRVYEALARNRLNCSVVKSRRIFLDVLPYRASKGKAIRYLSAKWRIPTERILTAGDSGNDRDMLSGNLRGIVVGNHDPELEGLRKTPHIYFSQAPFADGVLEGLEHFLSEPEETV